MGTAAILDVLGSMVIGGMLLLILFRLNDSTTQNTYNFSGELVTQQNMVTTVEVLEYDFRKIGYCENPLALPDPEENAILYADTSKIRFLTDVLVPPYNDPHGDGVVDTMEYYLGRKITSTPNPNDRMLFRIVNSDTTGVNLGITEFKIRYFRDSLMATGGTTLAEILPKDLPKSAPTGITAMEIDIQVENTATYNAGKNPYRTAFWRQIRLSSRNLNR